MKPVAPTRKNRTIGNGSRLEAAALIVRGLCHIIRGPIDRDLLPIF